MRMTRTTIIAGSVVLGFCLWGLLALMNVKATGTSVYNPLPKGMVAVDWVKEGPVAAPTLTAGPFDLHRRYRSMEGPYVSAKFKVGDLIAGGAGELPEDRVKFVEKDAAPVSSSDASGGMMVIGGDLEKPLGMVDTSAKPRELYWMKGFKMEVLDEKGNVMPTAEFICHLNLDVDPQFRNEVFPHGERATYSRLLTITQGQTEVRFPEGYAFPVASDEEFKVAFQAANRTTDQHRRLKHRATFYFVKDSELVYPVTAMYIRTPFVGVVVDRNYEKAAKQDHVAHPSCMVMSTGVNAPNSTNGGVYTDARGRVVSGHFVVPPGKHEYLSVVNDQDAGISSKDRTMRYGWVHIHPCCTKAFVRQCTGTAKEEIASASVVTDIKPNGIEIKHIDAMQKDGGILFKKGGHYEIGAQYDNTTGSALDSMVTIGMLFDDVDFKRPAWALPGYKEEKPFCGINECKIPQKKQSTPSDATVREFDPATDGPLLKTTKDLVIQTSAGPLHVTLNPAYGPQNATQIYKLLTSGVYNRTPFVRYEPNFVLQLAVAEHKVEGSGLTPAQSSLIRTLPLESEAQDTHKVKHSKYALSMAHDDGEPDSAKTSFSILLNDAPHLDGKYTIIGFLKNDAATNATMDKMTKEFDRVRPVILSCSK